MAHSIVGIQLLLLCGQQFGFGAQHLVLGYLAGIE